MVGGRTVPRCWGNRRLVHRDAFARSWTFTLRAKRCNGSAEHIARHHASSRPLADDTNLGVSSSGYVDLGFESKVTDSA